MDVYRQAGDIVRAVREGHGTAKALCLRKEMQKKKQTYAVVCETLRHYDLLLDVLEQAEFFQYYPRANRELAICMAYDVVLGKGVNTNRDSTAQAIQKSASYLREAYWHVKKHHVIPPRVRDTFEEDGENNNNNNNNIRNNNNKNSNGNQQQSAGDGSSMMLEQRIPRYARVNTLKIDVESLVERLRRAAAKRARDAEDNNNENNNNNNESNTFNKNTTHKSSHANRFSKGFRTLPDFTLDPIIPSLLIFPPGTDLHAHPAVRSGQLILQDRASCLPVCVLLNAVDVQTSPDIKHETPLEYVVDACAAPGNKTTQIAALGAPHVKVMALERDEKRADLLYKRVQSLGAGDYVNVVHMDFFEMTSADREAAEAILLDPSCSASGVLTRVDVSLVQQRQHNHVQKDHTNTNHTDTIETDNNNTNNNNDNNNEDTGGAIAVEEQGADFASNVDRVQSLARLQRKLLAHALLSFDNCRTVVYSTCSLHEEENEAVVRQVLLDSRVQSRGWTLSHIMPNTWKTRGRKTAEDTLPLDYTIRCDPVVDATNGFYVARFDRTCGKGKKS